MNILAKPLAAPALQCRETNCWSGQAGVTTLERGNQKNPPLGSGLVRRGSHRSRSSIDATPPLTPSHGPSDRSPTLGA